MVIVGIDPGLEGAIAALSPSGVVLFDMPTDEVYGEIDFPAFYGLLYQIRPELAVVEKLHGMPHFGANNFKFGGSYYAAIYACTLLHIPLERVTPQRWKKGILEGTKKDKRAAIRWAKDAYPKADLNRGKAPSHDRAEALALAEYGLRMKGGNK